jgi:hypothetical protein
MRLVKPDLDHWLADPALRIAHRREARADPDRLWEAAQAVRLADTSLLGRLVRTRIPGTGAAVSFDELFRRPPFTVLEEQDGGVLVSGLVGRIWTLRRDYPALEDPEDFRHWSRRGTARVLLAHWVQAAGDGRSALHSEARVEPIGGQGRLGLATVRPLVAAFGHLVGNEGIAAAVRRAEK